MLLRDPAIVEANGWFEGAVFDDFAIDELPQRGTTTIERIEPAPPIQPGDGYLITMTVNHNKSAVLSLTFTDSQTPLFTTT